MSVLASLVFLVASSSSQGDAELEAGAEGGNESGPSATDRAASTIDGGAGTSDARLRTVDGIAPKSNDAEIVRARLLASLIGTNSRSREHADRVEEDCQQGHRTASEARSGRQVRLHRLQWHAWERRGADLELAADGRLNLVFKGDEYLRKGSDALWPAMDWTRLPGITVEQNGHVANSTEYGVGKTDFAGGTGDGKNGASSRDSAPIDTELFAKKSWFFFDDFIVSLGSGLTDASAFPVETSVEKWPLSEPM